MVLLGTAILLAVLWILASGIRRCRDWNDGQKKGERMKMEQLDMVAPVWTMRERRLEAATDARCPVCLCALFSNQDEREHTTTTEVVRTLPCRHSFHAGCIDRWILNGGKCPVCRRGVFEEREVEVVEIEDETGSLDFAVVSEEVV